MTYALRAACFHTMEAKEEVSLRSIKSNKVHVRHGLVDRSNKHRTLTQETGVCDMCETKIQH